VEHKFIFHCRAMDAKGKNSTMRRPRIETFDLNLLRIFNALFQQGSVSAAGEEIGVSSSAISHSLGRLRELFDDELFVKGPAGMMPTARAAEIADRVAAVLTQIRDVLEPPHFKPELPGRNFKIRCNHFISWLILPYVMNRLRAAGLDIRITVQCDDGGVIADELDAGLIDLVIGTFGHVPERLASDAFLTDYWTWVMRADHPARVRGLTSEQIFQLPQLVIANSGVGRSIDGVLVESGLERPAVADKTFLGDLKTKSRYNTQVNGALVINSALVAPAILAQSDLVALLPARLATAMAKSNNLAMVDLERPDSNFEHRLIWHRKHGADPAIAWLRSILHAAVEDWKNRSSET
jgi:DNA-binding transcriptional LysR family regulator